MTVAQIDKNCVKRDTIDRIGEEFQDLQVDFFEEKTQKKKVPSLVCCWDPREDSRTRNRKTQDTKTLQDELAEFVH